MKKKIVVGIPTYNEEESIRYLTKQIDIGLKKYYKSFDCLIVNVDSESIDDTKKIFINTPTHNAKKYLNGGKNPRGKGKNLLSLFKFCFNLDADFVATVDGDVKSISPEWIFLLLNPIVKERCDYTVPNYLRSRFDANVTNHFIYPLIYSLFNLDIRQPIGGDFSLNKYLYRYLLRQRPSRTTLEYGIDIFMTCHAIGGGFKIQEVFLGKKIHNPGFSLLDYKLSQITQSAIEVARIYRRNLKNLKEVKVNLKKCSNVVTIDESREKPSFYKKQSTTQLKEYGEKFLENQLEYSQYFGDITDKIKKVVEGGRPTLSMEIWVEFLNRFLKICYKDKFNPELSSRLANFVTPILLWRSVSFWEEISDLGPIEIENRIRRQAELLKIKLFNK